MGKLYQRHGRWGIDYKDAHGQRVRRVVAGDKSVAAVMLADAMKAVEKMKAGVLMSDPREGKKAFAHHMDAYLAELKRLGRDRAYIYSIKMHLIRAAEEQKWIRLTDCTAQSVVARLQNLANEGLCPKTVNCHRADFSAFFGWCVKTGRLEANPCTHVAKTTVVAEKKRRALSTTEIKALLKAAPPERSICYLFLVFTGLRRAEARQIKWAYVHLDALNPFLEIPPSITKSGRPEAVPLVPELADALREYRGNADERDLVFFEIPSMPDFRTDLAAAEIEEEDARGRKVVLHSLRHSLATMLAVAGVPMIYAQKILRHRDIKLTAEIYTDEGMLPLSAAMNSLPSLTSSGAPRGPAIFKTA